MTTMIDLNAIRARLRAATPRPWGAFGQAEDYGASIFGDLDCPWHTTVVAGGDDNEGSPVGILRPNDAEFIAHAPEDIGILLAEVERLRERLVHWREALTEEQATSTDLQIEVENLQAALTSERTAHTEEVRDLRGVWNLEFTLRKGTEVERDEVRAELASERQKREALSGLLKRAAGALWQSCDTDRSFDRRTVHELATELTEAAKTQEARGG